MTAQLTLTLVLFAATALSAQTTGTPPVAGNPSAAAPATSRPDSTYVVIKKTYPVVYSRSADDQKLHGTVVIAVLFNEAGAVESSEVTSGDPLLARCVTLAIGKWQIEPFIHEGKPGKVKVPLTFEFIYDNPPVSFATGDPASQPAGPTPSAIISSEHLAQKYLDNKVVPEYPEAAKARHVQGTVELAAAVGKDGVIQELVPLSEANPLLGKAAWEAVRQWHFKPFIFQGKPSAFNTYIHVSYTMSAM